VVERGVIDRRLILGVLLIAAACGKRGSSSGGPSVGSGSAVLTLPSSAELPPGLAVTVRSTGELPPLARPRQVGIAEHYTVVAVVDVGPATAKLPGLSSLAITIDPARILAEYTTKDVTAAQLQPGGAVVDLPLRVVSDHRIDVTVEQPGTVMLVGPLEKLTVLGSTADAIRGSTNLLLQGDCTSWITPTSPKVTALARDPGGFEIAADRAIKLGVTLAPGPATTPRLHADEILARGTADSADASLVLASLLLAKGHPVRLVSGSMSFEQDMRRHTGVQQWTEVVLEGQPWFVDARELGQLRLVPLADATRDLSLKIARSCPGYPAGMNPSSVSWEPAPSANP